MTNKKITQKEVAKFCGVTPVTLQNWAKPQVQEGVKFYPPFGKHNLLKGAYLATYLYKYAENGEEAEHFNNAELLFNSIESALGALHSLKNSNIEQNIKDALLKSAISALESAKEVAEYIYNTEHGKRIGLKNF